VSAPTQQLDFTHRFIRGGARRTLLVLHGTGGDENDLLPIAQMLDSEASVLSPRGKVLENGMPRFFRRLAEGVFDLEDLVLRARELADFVRRASEVYGFDVTQLTAVGFSNGANIAAAIMLLHPGTLRSGVLFRAMVPLEPERRPDLAGTTVFLGAGRFDPIVPPENTQRLAALLTQAGADVTLAWQPTGHRLAREDVEQARRWLESAMSGGQ
jgi:predicted esterase